MAAKSIHDELKQYALKLPTTPGVYRYFDKDDELIYVGKAKSLKNRVSSYFQSSAGHSTKTKLMVAQIRRIEYTLVNTEFDALLLEGVLIKKHKPRYNILLKDDKSYPYIIITNERFPKIESTRQVDRKRGEYFGPYSSVKAMETILILVRKLFTIRTCSLQLTQANIEANKFQSCLEYHIGNCKAPCIAKQTEEEYMHNVQLARSIIKGEIGPVKNWLKQLMLQQAELLEFEKAHLTKQRLEMLDDYQSRSVIVNPKLEEVEVYTIVSDEAKAFVNFLKIQHGTIIMSKNLEIKKRMDESDADILAFAIVELKEECHSDTKDIISNIEIPLLSDQYRIHLPQVGDKKKLIDMSLKNALRLRIERIGSDDKPREQRVLETLQKDLHLQVLPKHIECFDNSNIQGSNPVASMVCFKMGKPAKKDYRHFIIKTVEGPNDFDSMTEIVTRRYSRLVSEQEPLPDLVVIDGGKGQLSAAMYALKQLGLEGKMPVIGIAKRLEEIYFPGDSDPILISKKSESLRLIQQIRNEAHRFAITFHRDRRSKNFIKSGLEEIEGVGPKTIEKLLSHFKSLKKLQQATDEQIIALIGQDKADKVIKELRG